MRNSINFKFKRAITHAGKFHADDVFSTAFLTILNPGIEVKRVNKIDKDDISKDTIIYDIGLGEFDHHQTDVPVRLNGIKYAAFGLLWKEFGHLILSERSVARFDEQFVQYIDAADNGQSQNPLSLTISSFMPNWDEKASVNEAFSEAVNFAEDILCRHFNRLRSTEYANSYVEEALEKSYDKDIVVLNRFTHTVFY